MIRRLLFLAAFAGAVLAQTSTVITIIPITNPTTGALSDPGSLVFRDLTGETAKISAPDTLMSSYRVRLWNDNTTGCLKNTATGANGVLSIVSCGGLPALDTTIVTQNAADPTKQFRLSNAGITAGQTRVATIPDADFTFAGKDITQTFTAVQTFGADLNLASDNFVKLGNGNRLYSVGANRFDGTCTFCSATDNYVTTRKLSLWDSVTGFNVGWDLQATAITGASNLTIRDNAGTDRMVLETQIASATTLRAKFALSLWPGTDDTYTIGDGTHRFKNATLSDLSGTGTRDICATSVGLITITGCPGAGANIQLSNLGTTAINANLLPGLDDTVKIGAAFRFYQISANRIEGTCSGCTSSNNYASTRKLNIFDMAGGSASWSMTADAITGASDVTFNDNAGTARLILQNQVASATTLRAVFSLSPVPSADSTYQLGRSVTNGDAANQRWSSVNGVNGVFDGTLKVGGYATLTSASSGSIYQGAVRDTGSSPGLNFYYSTTTKSGSISSGPTAAFSFQNGSDTHLFTIFQSTGNVQVASTSDQGFKFYVNGTVKSAGNVTIAPQAGFGQRCAIFDTNGVVQVFTTDCVPTSRTISTTGPITGGGDLSTNRTFACTTCYTTSGGSITGSVTASSFVSGSELRVSGNVVINSSGVLSNSFGVDVAAGVAGSGFNIHGGPSGYTGSTCSQWTGGICTAP